MLRVSLSLGLYLLSSIIARISTCPILLSRLPLFQLYYQNFNLPSLTTRTFTFLKFIPLRFSLIKTSILAQNSLLKDFYICLEFTPLGISHLSNLISHLTYQDFLSTKLLVNRDLLRLFSYQLLVDFLANANCLVCLTHLDLSNHLIYSSNIKTIDHGQL